MIETQRLQFWRRKTNDSARWLKEILRAIQTRIWKWIIRMWPTKRFINRMRFWPERNKRLLTCKKRSCKLNRSKWKTKNYKKISPFWKISLGHWGRKLSTRTRIWEIRRTNWPIRWMTRIRLIKFKTISSKSVSNFWKTCRRNRMKFTKLMKIKSSWRLIWTWWKTSSRNRIWRSRILRIPKSSKSSVIFL